MAAQRGVFGQHGFEQVDNAGILDPGDAGAISVLASGTVPLVSAAVETRTLAIPTFADQEITLYFQTDGGNIALTVASAINVAGNTIITFTTVDESITLRAVWNGAALAWRVAWNDMNAADAGTTSDTGAGLT